MTRFYLSLFAALLIAPVAFAADDGGFGTQRFSNQSPSALSGGDASSALAETQVQTPADIEPAAGQEDDQPVDNRDPEAIADDPDATERPPAE